jgi:uncharacterized protein (UPF0276 family)
MSAMPRMAEANPPRLGVGVVYVPGLEPLLQGGHDLIQVIEVEPQTFWRYNPDAEPAFRANPATIEMLRGYRATKLVHGVGFPVGGTHAPGHLHLPLFVETISGLHAPWASEHLSFNQAGTPEEMFRTGFLLPPLQTPAGARAAAASIRAFADGLPVPFAVENGANYLRPRPGEMSDGAFVRAVVEEADCAILLDLHNLWTNERNGRQTVADFVDEIPRERVWEMHIAGGFAYGGYWIDAHSGAIPEPLLDCAAQVIPRLPNLGAIIFEILPPFIPHLGIDGLREQLEALHRLWALTDAPRAEAATTAHPTPAALPQGSIAPEEWERTLGSLAAGQAYDGPLTRELRDDPGVEILQKMVREARAGMIVDALKLTSRLLLIHGGASLLRGLLEGFWAVAPPQLFASEEAEAFGAYLERQSLAVPYLAEVLDFERAVGRTLIDGSERLAYFSCDPSVLLDALAEGRFPAALPEGSYAITVTPPAAQA